MKIALKVEYLDGTIEEVDAVFADFPGPSGVSRRVTVPLAPTP